MFKGRGRLAQLQAEVGQVAEGDQPAVPAESALLRCQRLLQRAVHSRRVFASVTSRGPIVS